MIPASHLLVDSALGLQSHAAKLLEDSREGGKDDYERRPGELSRPMRLPAQLVQHLAFYGDCGNGIQTLSGSLRGVNPKAMEGLRMASISRTTTRRRAGP